MAKPNDRLRAALAKSCDLARKINLCDVLRTLDSLKTSDASPAWDRTRLIEARKQAHAVWLAVQHAHTTATTAERAAAGPLLRLEDAAHELSELMHDMVGMYDDLVYAPNSKSDPRNVSRAIPPIARVSTRRAG